MRIHRRIALILIVILALVTASFAADHTPTLDSGVGGVASTMAPPPERRSVPERSSAVRDDASRQKTLALLLLMLKEDAALDRSRARRGLTLVSRSRYVPHRGAEAFLADHGRALECAFESPCRCDTSSMCQIATTPHNIAARS